MAFNIKDRVRVDTYTYHCEGTIIICDYGSENNYVVAFDADATSGAFKLHKSNIQSFTDSLHYYNGKRISANLEDYYGRWCGWFEEPVLEAIILQEKKQISSGACCIKCNSYSYYSNPGFTCYLCKADPFRFK